MKTAVPANAAAHRELIRAAGARATPARLRVLEALTQAAGPLAHADIEAALAQSGAPMDRVTLYRVLDWLSAAGLAWRGTDARGVFRFSVARPNALHAAHAHFRCTACGGVFCLKAPPPSPPALPRGFRLAAMAVDLSGECKVCARSA